MSGVVSAVGVRSGESMKMGGVGWEVIDTVRKTVIIDDEDMDEDMDEGMVSEAGVRGLTGTGGLTPCDENSGGNDMIPD